MNDVKAVFPASFDTKGSISNKYHITLDITVTHAQNSWRRIPIGLLQEIEAQLQEMVSLNIITPKTQSHCMDIISYLPKVSE